jgi:hypothetical protein
VRVNARNKVVSLFWGERNTLWSAESKTAGVVNSDGLSMLDRVLPRYRFLVKNGVPNRTRQRYFDGATTSLNSATDATSGRRARHRKMANQASSIL